MNIHVQLTLAGAAVGDFNLYSNVDNFTLPFATHVTRDILLSGQVFAAPDGTNQIRIESNTLCTNSIFVVVAGLPDPTTSTTTTVVSEPSTTSTTTTEAEVPTCFNWRLSADPLEDSTFDITYCDDSTETLTVPANHSDFVCAKDVANPLGGAAFTEKLDPCIQ